MILTYLFTLAVIAWLGFACWYLFNTWREVKSGKPIIPDEVAAKLAPPNDHGGH